MICVRRGAVPSPSLAHGTQPAVRPPGRGLYVSASDRKIPDAVHDGADGSQPAASASSSLQNQRSPRAVRTLMRS